MPRTLADLVGFLSSGRRQRYRKDWGMAPTPAMVSLSRVMMSPVFCGTASGVEVAEVLEVIDRLLRRNLARCGGVGDFRPVAVGRAQRRREREDRFGSAFGPAASVALDLLEILELAWHDCYDELSPPNEVVDDIVTCADGDLARLVTAVRLSLSDKRDLRMWADQVRKAGPRRS